MPAAAGTISALSNSIGVVGVVGTGARLWMFNAFGPYESMASTDIWEGYRQCRTHLNTLRQKAPGIRMVVSMSIGATVDRPDELKQKDFNQEYARGDVLFFAAASNDGALQR
jgi:hypothetical protein